MFSIYKFKKKTMPFIYLFIFKRRSDYQLVLIDGLLGTVMPFVFSRDRLSFLLDGNLL